MLNFGNKEFRNLQEQVLENAKNIETLKGREDLKIVIVNELPVVGNPNYIYLLAKNDGVSPDVYDEYIWLENEQRYEKIGGVSIDLTNYVTTNTEQTITGTKSYTTDLILKTDIGDSPAVVFHRGTLTDNYDDWKIFDQSGYLFFAVKSGNHEWSNSYSFKSNTLLPIQGQDLGSSTNYWKDLYLAGQINFSSGPAIKQDSSNRIVITGANGAERIKIGGENSTYCAASWTPNEDNSYDLGSDAMRWRNINAAKILNKYSMLYLEGKGGINFNGNLIPNNIAQEIGAAAKPVAKIYASKIGSNSNTLINVADIVTKPNYANPNVWASGTLDANGEGTIDISAQGVGMPEDGLYMFTYGNTQCFIALTSTMIQNAAQSPMRCPCPLLFNGSGYPGNLRIDRNADILTLKVAAPDVGVATPSGMGWQLIKVM